MDHTEKMNAEVQPMPGISQHEIHKQYGLWLFRCASSGVSSQYSFEKCGCRYFQFYVISHLFHGHGKLWLENSGESEIREGDCVLVTPGTRNRYGGWQGVYQEDTINFNGPVADMLTRAGIISNGVFPMGKIRRLLPVMALMNDPAVDSQIKANMEFQKLLVELYLEKNSRSGGGHPLLEVLLEQLKNNPRKWWTVGEMAEMCNLSVDQLRRTFTIRTGVNPKLYLDRLKLNQAAAMLVNSERKISEIAEFFGYVDPYHFSRRFKAVLGMSPLQYRESGKMSR